VADQVFEISPEDRVIRRERRAQLQTALDTLSTEARLALQLAATGFSAHEIGHAINRSEGATRTLMCRSRMRVRQVLEADDSRLTADPASNVQR
jgi:DNA-directed RNA polymerase specialized sigma24 family protein